MLNIICFYIKLCNIQHSVPLKNQISVISVFKLSLLSSFEHIVLVRVINQDKWVMSTLWYWRNMFVCKFHRYYKVDYLCLTDDVVFNFALCVIMILLNKTKSCIKNITEL